jgi:hypothetical protein
MVPVLAFSIGKTFCLPPKGTIATARSILDLCKEFGARSLMAAPSILEEILIMQDKECIKILESLQFVAFGGSSIKCSVGDELQSRKVRLINHYGVAEVGSLSLVFAPKSDYDGRYVRLREDLQMEFTEVISSDNQIRYKLSVQPVDGGLAFEIQDQLIKKNGMQRDYAMAGRDDDIIVLATGEKVNPRILEGALTECDSVKGAIAFEAGKAEIEILVEPSKLFCGLLSNQRTRIWTLTLRSHHRLLYWLR